MQAISRRLEEYLPSVEPGHRLGADRGDAGRARRRRAAVLRRGAGGAGRGRDRHRRPGRVLVVLKRLGAARLRGAVRRRRAGRRPTRAAAGRCWRPTWCSQTMAERERLLAARQGPVGGGGARRAEGRGGLHRRARVRRVPAGRGADRGRRARSSTSASTGTRRTSQGGGRDRRRGHRDHHAQRRGPLLRPAADARAARPPASAAVPVFMGGVLNEDVDGREIPVDVRDDLDATSASDAGHGRGLVEPRPSPGAPARRACVSVGAAGRLRQHLHQGPRWWTWTAAGCSPRAQAPTTRPAAT